MSPKDLTTIPKAPGRHLPGEAGIWILVFGDMVMFSIFFTVFALAQSQEMQVFTQARTLLNPWFGLANTILLVSASWFVATGVKKFRAGGSGNVQLYFLLGLLCGVGFVINKVFEWGEKFRAGITPATNDFFMYYFIFTGIHLVHVFLGLGVLTYMRGVSRRATPGPNDLRNLESGATFWHLVDLLWIVLFAILYLAR